MSINHTIQYNVRRSLKLSFTSAIPLLHHVGTFACCVSALGQYVPYYQIWYIVNSFSMTMLIQCLDWTLVLHSDSLYMDLNSSRPKYQPPSSWITSARHYTQLIAHTKRHTFIPTKLLRDSFFILTSLRPHLSASVV